MKRLLRFRDEFFYISLLNEKLLLLFFAIVGVLYTATCTFQFVETHFQDQMEYKVVSMWKAFYCCVITAATVGYGDVVPTSFAGQIVIIALITVSLTVIPSLITGLFETIRQQKAGSGAYIRGTTPFVVVCGLFCNVNRLLDIINIFIHRDIHGKDINLLLLMRNDPSPRIKALLSNSLYRNRVKFLVGSVLIEQDLKRAQVKYALGAFILASREVADKQIEDEHNILRAWALDSFAPLTPLVIQI